MIRRYAIPAFLAALYKGVSVKNQKEDKASQLISNSYKNI